MILACAAIMLLCRVYHASKTKRKEFQYYPKPKAFWVSRYLERMEQAQVDILSNQKPIDKTIVLWWGLDVLRLNENGELEWITRKKEPENNSETDVVLYADNRPISHLVRR